MIALDDPLEPLRIKVHSMGVLRQGDMSARTFSTLVTLEAYVERTVYKIVYSAAAENQKTRASRKSGRGEWI